MVITGAALIRIDRDFVAVAPNLSVTLMAKLNIPVAVGMPEIAPVDESSDRPGGREPADTNQV